jgi:hypothetical protein
MTDYSEIKEIFENFERYGMPETETETTEPGTFDRDAVQATVDNFFNHIPLERFELLYEGQARHLSEDIVNPPYEQRVADFIRETVGKPAHIRSEFEDRKGLNSTENEAEFFSWLETQVDEHFDDAGTYPVWGTLLEAKDGTVSDLIEEKCDALTALGLGVLQSNRDLHTNAAIYFLGAGFDFFEPYILPMCRLLFPNYNGVKTTHTWNR